MYTRRPRKPAEAAVYAWRPYLRPLMLLGGLGLAGLVPRGPLPGPWMAVFVTAVPLLLLEVGAGVLEESTTVRGRCLGIRLQIAGAIAYVALYVLLAATGLRGGWNGLLALFLAMGALGLWTAAVVLRDARRLSRGHDLRLADPVAAGRRLAGLGGQAQPGRGRLRDHLTVVGGPIAALAGCLAFVAAGGVVLLARGTWPPRIVVATAFFGFGALLAGALALERRSAFVPGGRASPWQMPLQAVGTAGFGASLIGFAFAFTDKPLLVRLLGATVGTAMAIGAPLAAAQRLRRDGPGAPRVVPTREGLLELSRNVAVLYPWEAIASVAVGEWTGRPALLVDLALRSPEPIRVLWARRDDPRTVARRRLRSLARLRALSGCALPVMAPLLDEPVADVFERLRLHLTGERPRDALPSAWDVLAAWTPTGRRSGAPA